MAPVVSVHEYVLRPGVDPAEFETALREAQDRGLLALPGLREVRFLRTVRSTREHTYAALWTYESRAAWEALWGPPGAPVPRAGYPEAWRIWEDEILARFLDRDPDTVALAAYEEL